MAQSTSRLIVTQQNQVTRVEFRDRNILEEAAIQQIGDEITKLIDAEGDPKLLLSFSRVEHLSSAALGTLITINNKIKQKGGQLRLSNINPQIFEVFKITKLNKLFQIHDDSESALASFK
jgi:anti-sigma B factor antagonist